jgi:hypothetical protein
MDVKSQAGQKGRLDDLVRRRIPRYRLRDLAMRSHRYCKTTPSHPIPSIDSLTY